MKVSKSKAVGGASPMAKTTGKAPAGEHGGAAPQVEYAMPMVDVSISGVAQIVSGAKAALAAMPDIRMNRVSEIRLAVDSGGYKVDSLELARQIVNESLGESAHTKAKR